MKTQIHYLPIYEPFFHARHRHCLLYDGAGSGKSYAAAQKLFLRCLTEPGIKFLVVRKTASSLCHSVFALLESIIREAGLGSEHVAIRRGNDKSITFYNGSQILFTGCYDADRLKSIHGISAIWIEEATELTEQDFQQLELRVRGITPGYHQFLLTFNPIDQAHWLHARFFDSPNPKTEVSPTRSSSRSEGPKGAGVEGPSLSPSPRGGVRGGGQLMAASVSSGLFTLRTTHAHNPTLDQPYRHHLEQTLRRDPNLYRIYALGQWGHLRRGGEFYKQFDMARHVQPVGYKKSLPLHISFDFNLNPYITLTVWQVEGKHARQIDEICLSNPDNSTPALCARFLEKYGRHAAGLNIYGDPSGSKGNTQTPTRASDYNVIMRELSSMEPVKKVRASAPEVAFRGQFINRILMGAVDGIKISIAPTCTNTIQDYQNLQEAADGSKIKEMHTDKNGVRSQKYGHCSDANDYLLCRVFESEFRKYKRKGGILPPAKIQLYSYSDW